MTKCPYGYQTFSFLQWETLFFSHHFHFLVQKFNIFSTFGSNQDDHGISYLKFYRHVTTNINQGPNTGGLEGLLKILSKQQFRRFTRGHNLVFLILLLSKAEMKNMHQFKSNGPKKIDFKIKIISFFLFLPWFVLKKDHSWRGEGGSPIEV